MLLLRKENLDCKHGRERPRQWQFFSYLADKPVQLQLSQVGESYNVMSFNNTQDTS
jgi:hypothetical protein